MQFRSKTESKFGDLSNPSHINVAIIIRTYWLLKQMRDFVLLFWNITFLVMMCNKCKYKTIMNNELFRENTDVCELMLSCLIVI